MIWKQGDKCLLECDGEKWLAEIALASSNGMSLVVTFNGLVSGHLGMMPLLRQKNGEFMSIINSAVARLSELPSDWHRQVVDK